MLARSRARNGRHASFALLLAALPVAALPGCGSSTEAQASSPDEGSAPSGAPAPCDRPPDAPVKFPTARGRLTTTQIDQVVRDKLPAIEDCYVDLVKRSGDTGGKLRLHFQIDESGETRSARVRSPDITDGAFLCCVEKTVWNMRFPAPKGGDVSFVHEIELVQ